MTLKSSARFAMVLLIFHFMAVLLISVTAVAIAVKLVMLLLILISLIYYLARDIFLFLPDSWQKFSLDQGVVSIVTKGGSKYSGRLVYGAIVSPHLVILPIKLDGHYLIDFRVIFPDALNDDSYRKICVLLKFGYQS